MEVTQKLWIPALTRGRAIDDITTYNLLSQNSTVVSNVVLLYIRSSKVTAPQDAHGRLVLQVYLGSYTLEFSAIRK